MNFFFLELRIFIIIILAEIYNSLSLRSFIRIYSIEYFLNNQCFKIAKSLKNHIEFNSIIDDHNELVLLTRIQKGGGLGDIYNKITEKKRIFSLSTSIFEFRSVDKYENNHNQEIVKITLFGLIPRIKKILIHISNPNLEKIHVLNDSCDPLIYISYLTYYKNFKKFIFYHHADHTFSFGALEKSWTHIDLFQNQYHICINKKINPIFDSMINYL